MEMGVSLKVARTLFLEQGSVGQGRESSLEKVPEFLETNRWNHGGVDKQNQAAQSSGETCSGHSEGEVESHPSQPRILIPSLVIWSERHYGNPGSHTFPYVSGLKTVFRVCRAEEGSRREDLGWGQ